MYVHEYGAGQIRLADDNSSGAAGYSVAKYHELRGVHALERNQRACRDAQ